MRADGVAVPSPALDEDPRLGRGTEDLAVERFVAEFGVEAPATAVLPRDAGLDEGAPGSHRGDPSARGLGDELRTVVRTDMARTPRRMKRSDGTSTTSVDLGLRSMRIAGQSRVNSSMTSSMRNFLPSWVRSSTKSQDRTWPGRFGPEPHAGAVGQREPAPLRPLPRRLQPLRTPDPLGPLDVHRPPRRPQHRRDPAADAAAASGRRRDDVGGERRIVGAPPRRLALRRSVLPRQARLFRVTPLPDAEAALGLVGGWIEDCDENHPHSGLKMRLPREFIAAQTATA